MLGLSYTLALRHGLSCARHGIEKIGQFCIDHHLAAALSGDVERGLFFRGAGSLPFGERIRPVRELIEYLLNGTMPAEAAV